MRMSWLALAALASPAMAGPLVQPDAHYYGPMKTWSGVGYKHDVQKDGTWRIVSDARRIDGSDFAVNAAMYRAAELARDGGFPYVQLLSARTIGSRLYGNVSAFVIARPSASPAPPQGCKPGRCYTAGAAELLRLLGGPNGDQPGIAVPSYLDKFGRTVTVTGFGIGAVSASGTPNPIAPPPGSTVLPVPETTRPAPLPVTVSAPAVARVISVVPPFRAGPAPRRPVSTQPSYDDLLKAQQGVHGGDRRQGWTISD